MSGIGIFPFGLGAYGIGTPVTVPSPAGKIYEDSAGDQQGSRYINPTTGDFEFNSNGRTVGMRSIRQLVQMRVATDLGSASMRELGNNLKTIQRVTDNIEKQVDNSLRTALGDLVSNNLISIDRITIDRITGLSAGIFVRMQWRDLSTGETFEEKIQ